MQNTRSNRTRTLVYLLASAVVLVGALYFVLARVHHTQSTSASQYTKGEPANTPATNSNTRSTTSSTGTSTEPGDTKSNSGGSTTSSLLAPSGDFVSNHRPNLSGQPAPNTISSVCTTTPGASCTIKFTKGSEVKSLDAITADRGGSSYWNWSLQDVGLYAGSWTVTATATLDGQSKSTTDVLKLEVAE